jgi:plastocyanin
LNKNTVWGIVVVLLVVFGFYLFFNSQQQTTQTPQEQNSIEQQVPVEEGVEETVVEDETREIMVEGDEFSFSPSTITVSEGERIALTFKNVGTFPHNFVIDELGVETETIDPDEEDTVEFTADTSGTFAFYCSVGNHRQQGMEGEVDVE